MIEWCMNNTYLFFGVLIIILAVTSLAICLFINNSELRKRHNRLVKIKKAYEEKIAKRFDLN